MDMIAYILHCTIFQGNVHIFMDRTHLQILILNKKEAGASLMFLQIIILRFNQHFRVQLNCNAFILVFLVIEQQCQLTMTVDQNHCK